MGEMKNLRKEKMGFERMGWGWEWSRFKKRWGRIYKGKKKWGLWRVRVKVHLGVRGIVRKGRRGRERRERN